ncbi:hypothetical protein M2444_005592 [Paenibacillus sp. PastF-3]|uniref:hypothetical protein n=1 Tax=unclassified Paenibacillus TaxID=185978 RepID=UPI002477131F|nr:hypothetical protein [Paenibacillus sp. PastF-3]MDH6373749.1 hypothetical protein [Paenibacillus sp. PastF-3]
MSKNKPSKKQRKKHKRTKNIPVLESGPPPVPPIGIELLKIRESLTKILDKLFSIAKWDKKLYLDKIRFAFSPFMLIPLIVSWIEAPIHKLGAAPHVLQSTFPIILKTVEICNTVMYWLQTSGYIQIVYLLLSMKFIQILYKHNKHDKQLQEKMTPSLICKMLFDLVLLYSATQYFPGVLATVSAWAILPFLVITLAYIASLGHYQKQKGSYDPDQMLKRERRREKKRHIK